MITEEQIGSLAADPEFAAAANACRTEEEAIALFKSYGIKIDSWEAFAEECRSLTDGMSVYDGELDEEELEAVQGGKKNSGVCFIIGIGYGDNCIVFGFNTMCFAGGFSF